MINKIHYIPGSRTPYENKESTLKAVDGYAVVYEDQKDKYLLIDYQLPKDLNIFDLEKKLEDPVFLAKYYLEKEYNITSK